MSGVRPGRGRASLLDSHALRLGILRGLIRYLDRLCDPSGALLCPRHRVEHTGKNVYAALLHLIYARFTREEEHFDLARQRVLRAVDQLGPDPDTGAPVFLPGRADPRNASNHPIDGGACADVIATMLEEAPELFARTDAERCKAALEQHVEGYLRRAARDRPVPAQRLWAGTGVARAARLLERDDWRADALAGCALALEEVGPDGAVPYIPLHSPECQHPGLSDLSSFYHSRTPGFVLYIHDVLGEPLSEQAAGRLRACLDVLLALRGGLGRKVLLNEAKPWYWDSLYEVASHPFDAYALHTGARVLGQPRYAREAGGVMEEWIAHLDALDGGVRSHHGRGSNFQCRVFWTAHGVWAARVLEDVALRAAPAEPGTFDLARAGLVQVRRPAYTAVLRGAHRGASNLYGCGLGGGQLQSLVLQVGGSRSEAVRPTPRGRDPEGSFLLRVAGTPGRWRRLRRVVRGQRAELRFRLHVARVEWRARAWWRALAHVARHVLLRSWREASPWFAAHLDRRCTHTFEGETLTFRGSLADRHGERLEGASTTRCYRFEPRGVWFEDQLDLTAVRGRLRYVLPRALTEVSVLAPGSRPRRRGRVLELRCEGRPLGLIIQGRWRADTAS